MQTILYRPYRADYFKENLTKERSTTSSRDNPIKEFNEEIA